MWTVDHNLSLLFANASIVVDNARSPAFSLSASMEQIPCLSPMKMSYDNCKIQTKSSKRVRRRDEQKSLCPEIGLKLAKPGLGSIHGNEIQHRWENVSHGVNEQFNRNIKILELDLFAEKIISISLPRDAAQDAKDRSGIFLSNTIENEEECRSDGRNKKSIFAPQKPVRKVSLIAKKYRQINVLDNSTLSKLEKDLCQGDNDVVNKKSSPSTATFSINHKSSVTKVSPLEVKLPTYNVPPQPPIRHPSLVVSAANIS